MHQTIQIIILVLYLVASYAIGFTIIRLWSSRLPALLHITGGFLIGIGISVPVTYVFSCVFAKTNMPIELGVGCVILLSIIVGLLCRHSGKNIFLETLPFSDFVLVVCSLIFSYWLMVKTFYEGEAGQLFVGSNNLFDFGHALGIIRSFSWGSNIPFTSPFQAGLPFFYHFFFYFWVAIWEYFGVPVVWAMNIPSVLSFTALLIVVYFLPQIIVKTGKVAGWFAVGLTITNSSLTFWNLLVQKGLNTGFVRFLWQLPAYPFSGPFDDSTISLFMTLNNYVNQRHLAFAMALGSFLFILGYKRISGVWFGVFTGILMGWNMAVCGLVFFVFVVWFGFNKQWKTLGVYVSVFGIIAGFWLVPYIRYAHSAIAFLQVLNSTGTQKIPSWNIAEYLWQNLGLLPFIATVGFAVLSNKSKQVFVPFVAGFIVVCMFAAVGKHGFDQKFLSFFIIGINILAAIGLAWIWKKQKIITVLLFGMLIVSGLVDLIPIKNEFAFPLVSLDTAPVISWIRASTPTDVIFVSYSDIIDPVALAGRKNFFGFFGNIERIDRTALVARIYNGDSEIAKQNNISYILIPKWRKNDFPYKVKESSLRSMYVLVYEDDRFMIIKTGYHYE